MSMPDSLPLPEKRRGFTPRQVAAVFIKYEARCAKCHEKVRLGEYAIDHIQRLDALGKHELSNWQLLCVPCHKPKTKIDNREAKKGARIRGETCNGPKRKIVSRGFSARSKDEGTTTPRHAQAMNEKQTKIQIKGRSEIQSRPFSTTLRKKMNGEVTPR
jgi:hypothetical protein